MANPRGRPKGTTMRFSFAKYIEETDIKTAIKKLVELAEGISVEGEEGVYQKPPDMQAIKTLLEHGCGRPIQPIEGNLDTEITVKFKV